MTTSEALRKELYESNLSFFKSTLPDMYDALVNIGKTHSQLVFDENGNPDIQFKDGFLYGEPLGEFVKSQISSYMAAPFRIDICPPQSNVLDDVGADFNLNFLKKAVDEGNLFTEKPRHDDAFYCVVQGIGLGQHIEPLLEATNTKVMILIEQNIEFMYHSAFITDWKSIVEKLKADDRDLKFIVGCNPKEISHHIRNLIRIICPSFFDNMHIYQHYHNAEMELALNLFKNDGSVVLSGLGFVEDEEFMVRNSFNVLKDYKSYIFKNDLPATNMPCFVVGSGPSLTKDLDFIRENQDHAIVISCGTALSLLLKNGIRPNFHIEIENIEVVDGLLGKIQKEYGFDGITLVASTTVDPGVVNQFEDTVLFVRENLTSWWTFSLGSWCGIDNVGPTVGNCGLSFAQMIGLQEFYIFGIDLGTKDQSQHHAVGSVYETTAVDYDGQKFPEIRKGNLGGKVFTHNTFLWARSTFETQMRQNSRGRQYYNCADGLLMRGSIPKLSKAIKLNKKNDKSLAIRQIKEKFPLFTYEQFLDRWERTNWAENAHNLIDELKKECKKDYDPEFPLRYASAISKRIIALGKDISFEERAAIHMIRGSIFMMLLSSSFYLARVQDETKLERLTELMYDQLYESLTNMDKRIENFYATLTNQIPLNKISTDEKGDR